MFLKIFFISLIFVNLNANLLFDNIKNMIGQRTYKINKVLIFSLFRDQSTFYIGKTNLKYERILKILNEKGLLNVRFNNPQTINIEIISSSSSIKVIKTINDIFSSLGFSYYFTKEMKRIDGKLNWIISLKSDSMIDPYIFTKELDKLEANVLNIKKIDKLKWKYEINFDFSKSAHTIFVDNSEKVILQKPLSAYMLEINKAKELKVFSRRLNTWYPYISFYDEDLQLLGRIEKQRVYKATKVEIPYSTKYIRLDDTYTLLNIKRGLTVIVR